MANPHSITLAVLYATSLSAQGIVRDARTGTIEVTLIADANYSVSEMKITPVSRGAIDASNTTALYFATLSSGKDVALYALGKSSPVMLGASLFFNFASAVLSAPNTETRIYDFIIPIKTNYTFKCSLKGDIDNPRNRFRITSSTGVRYIDYQESFSSDVVRAFPVELPPGCYTAEVSVGSGSSSYFHTAGTLDSIRLWNPVPIQFTLPFACTVKSDKILDKFPFPGSSAQLSVTFNGFPSTNQDIVSGSVSYSGLKPFNEATVKPNYPYSSLRAVNKSIHVIQPQFHLLSLPAFDGTTATFNVQRDADWEYDLYPDDWYDQDGDGIPDPPNGGM